MSTRRQLKVFIDRCLGDKWLKECLQSRGFDADIVLHDEIFARGEDDLVWAQWAAQEHRIVLTRDLFRSEFQRRVLVDYGGLIVILSAMNTVDTLEFLMRSWPRVVHLATQQLTGVYKFNALTGRLIRTCTKISNPSQSPRPYSRLRFALASVS